MASVLARGMRGDLVEQVQQVLSTTQVIGPQGKLEPALKAVDGNFGATTVRAVQRVQASLSLPVTGIVDQDLWTRLTGKAWPDQFARQLSLLASFEGHSYTLAAGDYDGCGITWGVIGFTLVSPKPKGRAYGPLRKLLKDIFAQHRATMLSSFGADKAKQLEAAL